MRGRPSRPRRRSAASAATTSRSDRRKSIEAQAGLLLDEPRQLDRLLGGLDAGALAARIALDDDAERAPGDLGRLRQTGQRGRVVGGDDDLSAFQQLAQAAHLLLAQQIVADEDIVDAAVDHHLGLAQLLAGDALGAGRHLHLGEHGALVRLDVRPVGDAGGWHGFCTRAMLASTRSRSITTAGVPNSRAISVLRLSMLIGAFPPAIHACGRSILRNGEASAKTQIKMAGKAAPIGCLEGMDGTRHAGRADAPGARLRGPQHHRAGRGGLSQSDRNLRLPRIRPSASASFCSAAIPCSSA